MYIFMVFGLAMTYIAFQFWFLTKDVFVNYYIALALALLSSVLTIIYLPESPRFLYFREDFKATK